MLQHHVIQAGTIASSARVAVLVLPCSCHLAHITVLLLKCST
jgi:hypothetical protein